MDLRTESFRGCISALSLSQMKASEVTCRGSGHWEAHFSSDLILLGGSKGRLEASSLADCARCLSETLR